MLRTCGQFWLHSRGLRRCAYLDFDFASVLAKAPGAADPTGAKAEVTEH